MQPTQKTKTKTTMRGASITTLFLASMCLLSTTVKGAHLNERTATSQDYEYYHRLLGNSQHETLHNFLPPISCIGKSHEECQSIEDHMLNNARKLFNIIQKKGKLRVLVLCLQWTDHEDRELPDIKTLDEVFNGDGTSDTIPTGSMKQWIHANSHGLVQFEAVVTPWIMTNGTEVLYSAGDSALENSITPALVPALQKLDAEEFDFSQFDQDNDGIIDAIIVLHSGYAADLGGSDCHERSINNRIWSHAMYQPDPYWKSTKQNIRANGFSVASAFHGVCGTSPARISIVIHEFMHVLGLPDLFDRGYGGKGIGEYDIMANSHGIDGSQLYPAHLSPWSKMKLGWANPIEITHDTIQKIRPSENYPDIFIIRTGFPYREYLLIENRQGGEMWDKLLPGSGILIYHIDDVTNMRSRGYPGQDGFPGNSNHYQVSVVQADGRYDLEKGRNKGDAGDFWNSGSGSLGPGPEEEEATDKGVYPNTNSYRFGQVKQTGIVISNFTSLADQTMSFRVSGFPSPTPTQQPATEPVTNQPTSLPTTLQPSKRPNNTVTKRPSDSPIMYLTRGPSHQPTKSPTLSPSRRPTVYPTRSPTFELTKSQTSAPSNRPTKFPTVSPVYQPTKYPTSSPVYQPTKYPTSAPTIQPTKYQTSAPSNRPTKYPTQNPTTVSLDQPTPTLRPTTAFPTFSGTISSTPTPTTVKAVSSSFSYSLCDIYPEICISRDKLTSSSRSPSGFPSETPSIVSSRSPSDYPSEIPSTIPSRSPSRFPSEIPSTIPSRSPSDYPSEIPSIIPSRNPSGFPSEVSSIVPPRSPSVFPAKVSSIVPSKTPKPESVSPQQTPDNICAAGTFTMNNLQSGRKMYVEELETGKLVVGATNLVEHKYDHLFSFNKDDCPAEIHSRARQTQDSFCYTIASTRTANLLYATAGFDGGDGFGVTSENATNIQADQLWKIETLGFEVILRIVNVASGRTLFAIDEKDGTDGVGATFDGLFADQVWAMQCAEPESDLPDEKTTVSPTTTKPTGSPTISPTREPTRRPTYSPTLRPKKKQQHSNDNSSNATQHPGLCEVAPDFCQSYHIQQRPYLFPTPSPTLASTQKSSLPPLQPGNRWITIVLQLDSHPERTGYKIVQSDKTTIMKILPGHFSKKSEKIVKFYQVPTDIDLYFILKHLGDDSFRGDLAIYQGHRVDPINLLVFHSRFTQFDETLRLRFALESETTDN